MPKIIDILQRDHGQHDLLLKILERQIKDAHLTGEPDYDVVSAIVDYFLTFPAKFHHNREDMVYERLQVRDPEAAAEIGDLHEEHAGCDAFLRAFAAALKNVLGSGIITRSQFTNAALEFIDTQRRHMRMEENVFFPTALRVLTAADWRDLDANFEDHADPVFGETSERRFDVVRKEILEWSKERRVANDDKPAGFEVGR